VRYSKKSDKTKLEINEVLNSKIEEGALKYSKYQSDYPTYRLFYYLNKYGFVSSISKVASDNYNKELVIQSISKFQQSNILVNSEEGYHSKDWIDGYIAVGEDKANNHLAILAFHGGQASNDHYPQYNIIYKIDKKGIFDVVHEEVYFEDVAGIEGMRTDFLIIVFGVLWTLFLAILFRIYNAAIKVYSYLSTQILLSRNGTNKKPLSDN